MPRPPNYQSRHTCVLDLAKCSPRHSWNGPRASAPTGLAFNDAVKKTGFAGRSHTGYRTSSRIHSAQSPPPRACTQNSPDSLSSAQLHAHRQGLIDLSEPYLGGAGPRAGRRASPGEVVLLHGGGVGHHTLQGLLRAGVAAVPPEVVGRVIFFLISGQGQAWEGWQKRVIITQSQHF